MVISAAQSARTPQALIFDELFCKAVIFVILLQETAMNDKPKEIRIHFPERLQGGSYANNMTVAHTQEEFILDFLMISPPAGAVTARVVTSPGHMKRMVMALMDNLKKYEETYGKIQEAQAPGTMH